jgi:hypothetical protein
MAGKHHRELMACAGARQPGRQASQVLPAARGELLKEPSLTMMRMAGGKWLVAGG